MASTICSSVGSLLIRLEVYTLEAHQSFWTFVTHCGTHLYCLFVMLITKLFSFVKVLYYIYVFIVHCYPFLSIDCILYNQPWQLPPHDISKKMDHVVIFARCLQFDRASKKSCVLTTSFLGGATSESAGLITFPVFVCCSIHHLNGTSGLVTIYHHTFVWYNLWFDWWW